MRTVEVFADVLCPFTHVGLHTLIDRRTALGHSEPRLRIRAWPLELINGKPLDPHHIGAEITALRGSVRPDLFAGFSVDTFPTTSMAAFALTAAADRTGDAAVIEEVGMALRDAVFEQGLDIGRAGDRRADRDHFGLEPLDAEETSAAVRADWEAGEAAASSAHRTSSPATAIVGSALCSAISRDDVGNFVVAWKQGTEAFVDSLLG